jgi:predicted GNAT family acetyltransferase
MTQPATTPPVVRHNAAERRFEIAVDGRLAGLTAYLDHEKQRIFYHTEIADEFAGQGLGSILVREALQQTRAAGLRIVPVCPYVAKYVSRHHDFDADIDQPTDETMRLLGA